MSKNTAYPWLEMAKRLLAITQAGLEYSENKYDIDRYNQIRQLGLEIMHDFCEMPMKSLINIFSIERGYPTPKVDVRGIVFRGDKILMVKETVDNRWSVPGGWADIGFTPFEVAKKEVREEAGLEVLPVKLLAVLDKKCHDHPPDLYHIYKIFVLCKETGGILQNGMETSDTGFFSLDKLPPLSEPRITEAQIKLMFEYKNNPDKVVLCD
jgi:ADP-ribose pyrophosphatase YjhB (NUDIX family)